MGTVTWGSMYHGTSNFSAPTNGKVSIANFIVFDGNNVYMTSFVNNQ